MMILIGIIDGFHMENLRWSYSIAYIVLEMAPISSTYQVNHQEQSAVKQSRRAWLRGEKRE